MKTVKRRKAGEGEMRSRKKRGGEKRAGRHRERGKEGQVEEGKRQEKG